MEGLLKVVARLPRGTTQYSLEIPSFLVRKELSGIIEGYNLKLVQHQLGHASITTSSVYLSIQNEELNAAVEKL